MRQRDDLVFPMAEYERRVDELRRRAAANEAGMKAGIAATEPGVSENDIAAEVRHAMFKAGGEYPACSPLVASHQGSRLSP